LLGLRGADSDVMLDLLYRIDYSNKISYIFIDTGFEMRASKEHISFLENKYGIHIERIKPEKPLPIAIKEVGYPFLAKHCSQMMSRAKKHGFDGSAGAFSRCFRGATSERLIS